ncbi:uncharacterized protein BO97DRAFT_464592 [Aspergillus homomorphus CBS 101889]|uniref:Uncharacterized protein n=1 Tax=Aspergillus homomorphus (strain CBS 101889) TaxID=1450537 RepID=A0A395HJM4_ASPHC|nr:hypothetical protein BO97DRAFT_464592 [Aspergillus homomorphus CBS 101889]RAL07128.1 hypothetical protein BO97DRAFT_464592 [Aspergillus homomorphus CBS 101889]
MQKLVYRSNLRTDLKIEWQSPDHIFLGDALKLKVAEGTKLARDVRFALPNGLKLTYGEINALAGDFYGTWEPISDPDEPYERTNCFNRAWETLALGGDSRKVEANNILAIIYDQKAAVEQRIKDGESPANAYKAVYVDDQMWNFKFQGVTGARKDLGLPTYVNLAAVDWDHFGADARLVYRVGHDAAVAHAYQTGDLMTAYAKNAFADHFLQDSFSAGHVRTPRRALHAADEYGIDHKAQVMHDEDGANGLVVSTAGPCQQSWRMYGDNSFLEPANHENRQRCSDALQTSADEVFEAWRTGANVRRYGALEFLPTIESAFEAPNPQPLYHIHAREGCELCGNEMQR